jgi:hypothetical protein
MGWLQYSRPLWLSIGNPYILYLKAITAWMPIYGSLFSTASRVRLYCMDLALLFRLKSVGLLVPGRGVRGYVKSATAETAVLHSTSCIQHGDVHLY